MTRRSYEDSCRLLQELGYCDESEIPPMPDHRPQSNDEGPLGVSFFRTIIGEESDDADDGVDCDLENLTLPRTFFGRSAIQFVSFKNTDLSESTLCWSDFSQVYFTDADLSGSDLRASSFDSVDFVRANLQSSDLRQSRFEACDFTDAIMRGAKLTREQGGEIELSAQQRQGIDWQDSDGEEPPGG